MNKKSIIILIAIILLGIILYSVFVPRDEEDIWQWKEDWYEAFTLSNGMKVIVIPNSKIPAVSHIIWYRIGAMDEPYGKSGIAHFLEHLMFKGTLKHPDGKFSKTVAEGGGQENAFTSQDYTAYYQKVPLEQLETVMEMEADRMKGLTIADEQMTSERSVVLEERNMQIENNPRSLLNEQMDAALFQNHPYGNPLIGWKHEIEALNTQDALDFYHKYYDPQNAILIVGGDITAEKLKPLAEKYYGAVQSEGKAEKLNIIEPPQRAERRVIMRDERVKQDELWIDFYAPSHTYGASEHAYALTLLSKILGGGTISRLYQELVVKQKIAVMAGAQYSGLKRGPGSFTIYAIPAEGKTPEEVEAAIHKQLNLLITKGVTEDELASAKKSMIAEMLYSREGLLGLSIIMGQVVATGLEPEFVSKWTQNIGSVTAEQIRAAAAYTLKRNNSVTGVLKGNE